MKQRNGKKVLTWEKTYERNEPIDVRCYAWAAQLAAQEHLSIRVGREYPLPAGQLTFWKDPKEPTLRRQKVDPRGDVPYMRKPTRRRPTKLTGKTLSKSIV